MKRAVRAEKRNDDEWYTPRSVADRLASCLSSCLPLTASILCPADILPAGSESTIPCALRAVGFSSVRVTRDLPLDPIFADWRPGEIIVTNPPFSLLVPFRSFLRATHARFCILTRPATIGGWPIVELGKTFRAADGREVSAVWMQNIIPTARRPDESLAIDNCATCSYVGRCPTISRTHDWTPGQARPLFGWGIAVRHGIAGNWCLEHRIDGKKTFARFFYVDPWPAAQQGGPTCRV